MGLDRFAAVGDNNTVLDIVMLGRDWIQQRKILDLL
jgi:hypothetical protein